MEMTKEIKTTEANAQQLRNVLVVDDSKTMRGILSKTISRYADFNIIEAGDGVDALEKMQNGNIRLIFLDYNMPRMNGIEFMKNIRSQSEYKNIPVVMLTTESEEAKVRSGYVAGATVYMTKPYQPEALIKVVEAMRYWHMK